MSQLRRLSRPINRICYVDLSRSPVYYQGKFLEAMHLSTPAGTRRRRLAAGGFGKYGEQVQQWRVTTTTTMANISTEESAALQ